MAKKGGARPGAGRAKGGTNKKTREWEVLAESITGRHAESFNHCLAEMFMSDEPSERYKGMELYVKVLSYFKPQYSRVAHEGLEDNSRFTIIIPESL